MALTKVPSNLDAAISVTQSSGDNSTKVATTSYVDTAISALSDSAPAALNTLNEIAAALGDDANYASTTTAAIAAKLPLSGGTMSGDLNMNSQDITNLDTLTSAHFITRANVNGTGQGGAFIPSGKRLGFDQSGTRSWTQYAAGGNLLFASGDGAGAIQANNFTGVTLALSGTSTLNGTVTIATGATTGSRTIKDNYANGSLANQGFLRSSGGNYWTYGAYQDGSANWKSAVSVALERSIYAMDEDSAYWSFAPSQTVAIGSDLTTQPVEKIRFDLQNGRVGIGEAAPANLLHVKASDTGIAPHGSAQIVLEREGTNYLQFLTAENGTSGILFGDGSDVDVSKIYVDHNTTKMTFVNEASETMTLNGNKVGIGTVTPDLTLDVTHATAAQYIATFQNTGSNLQLKLGCEAVGYLNIQGARIDNGNPYNLSLQADGSNVGIGITVTDSKLHIKGAASNGIAGLVKIQQTPTHSYSPSSFIGPGRSLDLMTASNSNADSSGIRFANPGGSRETFIGVVQTGGQGDLVIQGYNGSAYGERFRVKADGSIGINNTAPAASISIGTDNAYVQEWEYAKGFKRHDTGVSGANGNYNISTYINVQSYRGLCVDYYESGHYFNNGAAYYFRHSKIYVILEGSTLRVGDVVLVRSTGNRTDAIVNAPSIAVSASGQFTITSTILSGFAHYVSVDVSGSGFISIGAIG